MSNQVFHLKEATSTVGSLLWKRSTSAGRMAVAPQAIPRDMHVPVAFHTVANSFSMQVLQCDGSSCSWNVISSVGVRGGWL